ncbi:helix-turn-helix transcriptional regulator [Pseudooceanicola sp. CBS1P-1]|uniref:Helix-turn-helix domain-containing protein n=1 Tax=Pseudooceanicola albus TaxID=2692189 RepID=A0A6L7G6D8_9RHOB|nr:MULTISPECIES: helix-turn-helix transcriptional regulator [Pseudooceanicola]MBT9385501.1 helix-turn-helix transcriptional regulator [Pseudooceanicola endophyticus]MXN19087.1 helix-turn-helix domain-containing protein [Pseudooceanicola albus]
MVKTNVMEQPDMSAILATNLRAQMERRSLSMAQLSRKAGTNDTAVYDILKQRTRSPKLDTIAKLADALEVRVIDLLTSGDRSAAEQEILAIFERLSPQDQQRLLLTARAWKSTS